MTGWRIGYAAGPAALIAAINKLQSQMSSCPSSVSQAAAAYALSSDQSFVSECVKVYKERRDYACSRLNAVPGLSCLVPDGAFYLFPNCAGVIGKKTPEARQSRQTSISCSTCWKASGSRRCRVLPSGYPLTSASRSQRRWR